MCGEDREGSAGSFVNRPMLNESAVLLQRPRNLLED